MNVWVLPSTAKDDEDSITTVSDNTDSGKDTVSDKGVTSIDVHVLCSGQGFECSAPNVCVCKQGWQGNNCNMGKHVNLLLVSYKIVIHFRY